MSDSKIIYTLTDEAPLLATYAFLPIIETYAEGGGADGGVFWVDVAAHLEPELGLGVQAEEDHASGWVDDDSAGGEVVGEALAA